VRALELQADCALLAHSWRRAAVLYATAAAARHHLAGPVAAETAAAGNAVTAFAQIAADPAATATGLCLAHTLAALCRPDPEWMPAVLRHLRRPQGMTGRHHPTGAFPDQEITCP
jgi:hypothetical protein